MAADTKEELTAKILEAFERQSNVVVNPVEARKKIAQDLAQAINDFVVNRETLVTGTSVTGGAVTGNGKIQ